MKRHAPSHLRTPLAEQKVQAKRMQLLKKNKFLRQHHLLSDTAAEKSGANGHNHDRHESPAATAAPAVSASAAAEKKHAVQKSAAPTTLEKSRTSHKPHTAPSAVAAKLQAAETALPPGVYIGDAGHSRQARDRADREASAASAPVQETREEREARLKRSREQRKATYKKLTARTKKGQLKMSGQISRLLDKIKQSQ